MTEVLTAIELQSNFEFLIQKLKSVTTGDKQKNVLSLYDTLSDRIATAPASSTVGFHGAYCGGYCIHVIKVIECADAIYDMWSQMGADMSGYTKDELIFAAINHDLGKIGSSTSDYYLPNTSEWHIKNQGKIYISNPDLPNMTVPDRSLFLLQEFNVPVTENEWIAIKSHDGLFAEENKPYWVSWDASKKFKNNMPIILHHADFTAFRIEFENERNGGILVQNTTIVKDKSPKKPITSANGTASSLFDAMFKDIR